MTKIRIESVPQNLDYRMKAVLLGAAILLVSFWFKMNSENRFRTTSLSRTTTEIVGNNESESHKIIKYFIQICMYNSVDYS